MPIAKEEIQIGPSPNPLSSEMCYNLHAIYMNLQAIL